jgi:hypothetical protein
MSLANEGKGVCGINYDVLMPNVNLMFGHAEAIAMITILTVALYIITPLFWVAFLRLKKSLHFMNPSQEMLRKIMVAQSIVFFSVWLLFCCSQGQHGK